MIAIIASGFHSNLSILDKSFETGLELGPGSSDDLSTNDFTKFVGTHKIDLLLLLLLTGKI